VTLREPCAICFNLRHILVTGGCIHRDVEAVIELTSGRPHLSSGAGERTLPAVEGGHRPGESGPGVRTVPIAVPVGEDGTVNDTWEDR